MKPESRESKKPTTQAASDRSAKSAQAGPSLTALARVTDESAGLPMRQRTALVSLAAGRSFAEAARAAGVTRQAIYEWRKKDCRFAAIYNGWQNATFTSAQHRLLGLADDAVTTVGDAITSGDVRASLELLRRLGILAPTALGKTDPAQLQHDATLTHREENGALERREQLLRADAVLAKMVP